MRRCTGRERVERKLFQKHATAVPQQEGHLRTEHVLTTDQTGMHQEGNIFQTGKSGG